MLRGRLLAVAGSLLISAAAQTPAEQGNSRVVPPPQLEMANSPTPTHEARDTSLLNTRLRWTPGRNAISHNVYFGTSHPPRFRGNQSGTTFDPGPLDTATTYFWRVDSVTPGGVVQGPTWTFMTASTARFVLVGDSTVTDDIGWGRGFTARLTSRSTIVNMALNGRSSRSFIDEGHWRAAVAQGADVILIQFGHNDMPGKGPERETDPATTYRAFLARYITPSLDMPREPVSGTGGAIRPVTPPSPAPRPIAWSRCLDQPAAWYASDEAVRIADLVRLYQRTTGGWPKNTDMARPLDTAEQRQVEAAKNDADSTIDNDATTTQLRFLALAYSGASVGRFRAAFDEGLDYVLAAQYPNGGWPQFYPLRSDYSRRITFNDDAMVHVMEVLRDAAAGRAPYAFVDSARRARAAEAVLRGVKVILASQIRVHGRLTAWCAQHDEVTLEPRQARTYEHPSFSGRESVGIASFLMSIPNPDAAVVAAVDAAVAWLRGVRLEGLRVEGRPDASLPGGVDRVVVKDRAAAPIWARFYEIGTNRPIFSGRDSVIRYDMAEIEHERRVNCSWYGSWPAALLDTEYSAWKRKHSK